MNDDLISRQAAIDAAKKLLDYYGTNDITKEFADHTAEEFMNRVPSAQPERKKGRWLPDNRPGGGFWVCSECKFPSEAFAANVLYKFCPNCGAKMQKGGE